MNAYFHKRNGLNDDIPPKYVDGRGENFQAAKPTQEQLAPIAGLSSNALHRDMPKVPQIQNMGEPLLNNIPPNQQIPPVAEIAGKHQLDLNQNKPIDSNQINSPPIQQVQNLETGVVSSPNQGQNIQQNIQQPIQTQIPPMSAAPQNVVSPINVSQQLQQPPESPVLVGSVIPGAVPHLECPRCATYIPTQAAQNYFPNVPLSANPAQQYEPPPPQQQQQQPQVVENVQITDPGAGAGAVAGIGQAQQSLGNQDGSLPNTPQVPCNQGGQQSATQQAPQGEQEHYCSASRINGLQPGQQAGNITEITMPQAYYNAIYNLPPAGVPTKYGHNYFYR